MDFSRAWAPRASIADPSTCSPKSTSARRASSGGCTSSRCDAKEKGPACAGTSPRPWRRLLLAGRRRLAVLPNVDVVDRILDVALCVVGERPHGRLEGAGTQHLGDGSGVGRLGLVGGIGPHLDGGVGEQRV